MNKIKIKKTVESLIETFLMINFLDNFELDFSLIMLNFKLFDKDLFFNFIDLKSTKLLDIEATYWLKKIEWSQLINKRSLTWKALTSNEKAKILDINSARSLIVNQPLVVKRPVIKYGKEIIVGFSEKNFKEFFGK